MRLSSYQSCSRKILEGMLKPKRGSRRGARIRKMHKNIKYIGAEANDILNFNRRKVQFANLMLGSERSKIPDGRLSHFRI